MNQQLRDFKLLKGFWRFTQTLDFKNKLGYIKETLNFYVFKFLKTVRTF